MYSYSFEWSSTVDAVKRFGHSEEENKNDNMRKDLSYFSFCSTKIARITHYLYGGLYRTSFWITMGIYESAPGL